MTWQRQEIASACASCLAYWDTLQDLGEEWDAVGRPTDPEGWGRLMAQALVMYTEHLGDHVVPQRSDSLDNPPISAPRQAS